MKKDIFFQAIKLRQYLCGGKYQPTSTLPVLWGSFNYQDSRDFPHVRKILPKDIEYQLSSYIIHRHYFHRFQHERKSFQTNYFAVMNIFLYTRGQLNNSECFEKGSTGNSFILCWHVSSSAP